MAYQTSQGLASLGRNGDSVLVHMNPTEVAGLQGLAMSQGGSLTINPHTGLPEAFKLGGFFKSLLPTIAGGLVSMVPGMQPFGLSAMQAGILAGAATGALTNRDNPLMGAALGGLGGYGGVGIGDALTKTMAITSPAAAASSGVGATISGIGPGAVGTTGQIGGANLIGSGVAGGTAASKAAAQNIMTSMKNAGMNVADPIIQDATRNALQTLPKTSNFSGVNIDPTSSFLKSTPFDQAYGASTIQPSGTMGGSTLIGEGRNLANSAASAQNPLIAGAMSNSPTPGFGETFIDQLGGTRGAVKQLGLPLGGALLGGLEPSDLYGEPINMDEAKRKQRYDPNATLNLSGDTGLRLYATGGSIQSGGIRDLYGTPDNQPTISPGLSGFGLGRLNNLAGEQAMTQAQTLGYADGGDVEGGNTGMNLDQLPSLNLMLAGKPMDSNDIKNPSYLMSPFFGFPGGFRGTVGGIEAPKSMNNGFKGTVTVGGARFPTGMNVDAPLTPKSYALNLNSGKQEAQYAMGGPVSFADGGDSNKEDALGLPSLSPDMSMDPNAGAGNLAMIQSAMQPTQGMQGNAPMTLGQMPDQSNDSLIAKVTANLKVDPNYQPENPIEAAIVKQIKGTDPMQQGQLSQQGLGSLGPSQPMAPSFNPSVAMGPTYFAGMNAPRGYADGGDVVAGEKGMSLDKLPSLNVETGKQISANGLTSGVPAYGIAELLGDAFSGNSAKFLEKYPKGVGLWDLKENTRKNVLAAGQNPSFISMPQMIDAIQAHAVSQGRSAFGNYDTYKAGRKQQGYMAKGGYLDGQGDGMSDSIPATIEGKQPARLADGEFVVPADVVSHLGNGSSKAGSKRLYAMLDKVRHARTGNKKQGKQINPAKYMPA